MEDESWSLDSSRDDKHLWVTKGGFKHEKYYRSTTSDKGNDTERIQVKIPFFVQQKLIYISNSEMMQYRNFHDAIRNYIGHGVEHDAAIIKNKELTESVNRWLIHLETRSAVEEYNEDEKMIAEMQKQLQRTVAGSEGRHQAIIRLRKFLLSAHSDFHPQIKDLIKQFGGES